MGKNKTIKLGFAPLRLVRNITKQEQTLVSSVLRLPVTESARMQ